MRLELVDSKGEIKDMLEDMFQHFGTKHWGTTAKIIIRKTHRQMCPEKYKQPQIETPQTAKTGH